ncbi:TPA: hypothetical protein EYG96_02805 [Candidatus Gracilibacteria bacterium]|nr:hypothetical protein [Candidatus Peregrinibacteria bacterium]HIQ56944.1 hypothetical protein [Candidatus Gracilibacteria bacterium]HIQ57466.1 hypothetical protein [Candidatus Gracilibacteria bacterium]
MKINKSFYRLSIGALVSSFLVSGAFALESQADNIVFEGDGNSTEIIIKSDNIGNSTLYFGDTLNNFLQWNADENAFIFSNNVDFGGNQVLNMRIEHITSTAGNPIPDCDSTQSGRLYYNTIEKYSYVCNGERWKQIDEESIPAVVPFIESVFPTKLEVTVTTQINIKGKGFMPNSQLIIPGFSGIIENFTLVSPSEITVDITPDTNTLDGAYDFIIDNSGKKNTEWTGNGVQIINIFSTVDVIPGTVLTLWERTANVDVSEGSIFPQDNGVVDFDKGGSFGTVPENSDFSLTFTPKYIAGKSSDGYGFIGIDNEDPSLDPSFTDYAFYFNNNTLELYENNVKVLSYGAYNITDLYKIIRSNNIVYYVINNTIIYTSTIPSNSSMVFDAVFIQYIGAENIKLTY